MPMRPLKSSIQTLNLSVAIRLSIVQAPEAQKGAERQKAVGDGRNDLPGQWWKWDRK